MMMPNVQLNRKYILLDVRLDNTISENGFDNFFAHIYFKVALKRQRHDIGTQT